MALSIIIVEVGPCDAPTNAPKNIVDFFNQINPNLK